MGLFRNPDRIPEAVRGLAYASMILPIPTFVFTFPYFLGFRSLFMPATCAALTWVYHIVIVVAERRGRRTEHAAYASRCAMAFGIILAVGWIGSICASITMSWVATKFGDSSYWTFGPLLFAQLDLVCTFGHTGVMWALVFCALKGRGLPGGTQGTGAVDVENALEKGLDDSKSSSNKDTEPATRQS